MNHIEYTPFSRNHLQSLARCIIILGHSCTERQDCLQENVQTTRLVRQMQVRGLRVPRANAPFTEWHRFIDDMCTEHSLCVRFTHAQRITFPVLHLGTARTHECPLVYCARRGFLIVRLSNVCGVYKCRQCDRVLAATRKQITRHRKNCRDTSSEAQKIPLTRLEQQRFSPFILSRLHLSGVKTMSGRRHFFDELTALGFTITDDIVQMAYPLFEHATAVYDIETGTRVLADDSLDVIDAPMVRVNNVLFAQTE